MFRAVNNVGWLWVASVAVVLCALFVKARIGANVSSEHIWLLVVLLLPGLLLMRIG
jgi:hypothetical protein